jgi:hypothetical protein
MNDFASDSELNAGRNRVGRRSNVRFGSLTDICSAKGHVRFAPNSDRESEIPQKAMSATAESGHGRCN